MATPPGVLRACCLAVPNCELAVLLFFPLTAPSHLTLYLQLSLIHRRNANGIERQNELLISTSIALARITHTHHCGLDGPFPTVYQTNQNRDGGQAEFVRVPNADGTVMKAPPEISDRHLVLMADIFPTGFFGARNAFARLNAQEIANGAVVVVGCGPVGICAIIAALEYKPKYLFAVDSIDSRLEQARKLGAEPLNFAKDKEGMLERIKSVTGGRGADAVIEVVGLSPALRTAFDLIRPWGVISSIGVHNAEIPWTANEGYNKNVRLQMGRCPVRSIFPEALALLAKSQDKLE